MRLDQGQILHVHRALVKLYGEPKRRVHRDALSQLVITILSQSNTDVNTARAFSNLRARFPRWELVRDAPRRDIVRAIRSAGLANTKAPRIQAIMRQLTRERGKLSLDFLRKLSVKEARDYMLGMKGVGPKTAAIVLLFTFGMPAFPVDTHIYRVTKRLGWIGARDSRERAHEILEELVSPRIFYPFHLNLIEHGRAVCKAGRPRCEVCPLQRSCEYYQHLHLNVGANRNE
jgi:endonuclease-3